MNCAEFEKRLQTAVERRLPMSGGSLREHASHCARCGELWQEAVFLERVIEAWAAEVKSANLTDGVLRRLTAEEARAGRLASDAVPVRPAELTVVALTRPDATGRSERIRGRTARAVVA
ncbi:MAG: hypothetical protein GXP27_07405, partial [Planctomycetes bacterium]|nr:hypothetical protein [Planctomycetota bacterium]